ncbi:DUF1684 domain-containing protein [Emticicia fluvialis]|uniref:DUF1684 domain-containing protein n=1 Tax=Emticicia fluvialis TaxID=2974474 RepID=UPI002165991C|nr:DUF1684 domain-containing protein [Emticicia fluvialis]
MDKPYKNGKVYLDFNKAISPPCAFTHYVNCPLPQAKYVAGCHSGRGQNVWAALKILRTFS